MKGDSTTKEPIHQPTRRTAKVELRAKILLKQNSMYHQLRIMYIMLCHGQIDTTNVIIKRLLQNENDLKKKKITPIGLQP